jgi:alginate O-acetyltransferase complex protein AlgI
MTLTRFLTAYIYNPLVLWLTRRRLARKKPGFGGRDTNLGAFVFLLMFPMITTMFVSGLWHGAGYGFIVWGLIHGFYLTINHGWRLIAARLWPDRRRYDRVMEPVGLLLTFVSVTTAMIFFRAPTMTSAIDLVKGVIGVNGIALPMDLFDRLGPLAGILRRVGVIAVSWSAQDFVKTAMWISFLMFVAFACPNTLQMLAPYEPALGIRPHSTNFGIGRVGRVTWRASLPWAIAMSAIAGVAIFFLGGPSEFLYWQF